MKLGKLKYALLALVLLCSAGESYAQLYMKHPTDVRYIGGNMTNKRPFFKSLDAALNDIKALATSERPYTFWVISDTVNVVDWDSVYQSGGLTMKDSIDIHYVAVGKIKWAGFGFGGSGGGGITSITPPNNLTTHYSLHTWTGQSGLSVWQQYLGANADSIDERIWELIVYTDSTYLYIENDTLKMRTTTIQDLIDASSVRPDTTIIAYKAVNETITGDWTFNGGVTIGTGFIRLPSSNNNTGVSRIFWSTGNKPFFSGAGATGDYGELLLINVDTGTLNNDSLITWQNLNVLVRDSLQNQTWLNLASEVQDSIRLGAGLIYHETYIYKDTPSTVSLLTAGGWLTIPTQITGVSLGMGTATDSSITVVTAGLYKIDYSISYTGGNSQILEASLFINDVIHPGSGFWRKLGTGADVGSSSGTCLASLSLDDVIKVKLRSPGVTNDITVHIFNLNIHRIK